MGGDGGVRARHVRVGEAGLTRRLPGTQFDEYFAYGAEVLAAADGHVVASANDEQEGRAAMRQPAESEVAYLARLQQDQAVRIGKGARAVIGISSRSITETANTRCHFT